MRKILVRSKSKTLSQKDLWKTMTTLEDYPNWCKFCIKMIPAKLEEGAEYHDITTLLWIPLKIKHVVIKIEPHNEFHTYVPLPGGGQMWQKFNFSHDGEKAVLLSEITFDLGSRIANATVGHILEKRWMQLARQGFPGSDEYKRL
jgi:hypothetical protein